MKKITSCDFCKGSEFKELFSAKDRRTSIVKEFWLVKCKKCGLMFLNPQPSFKELEKHYPKGYYSLERIQDTRSKKTRLKLFLYDLYFNPKNKNRFLKILFSPVLPYVKGTYVKEGAKLLDVGCGSGQFLYEMKIMGLDVQGVEPGAFDKESANKYGLKIKKSDLVSAKYPGDYFDIVTISHVLEHVPNPSEILMEMKRVLKKEGRLIIGAPNYNSFAYSFFKDNWYGLDVPRHLHNFSDKILIRKLKEQGFKINKIRYNGRHYQFSTSLRYYLKLKANGKILKVLNLAILPFMYLANILEKGDQVEIHCIK